MKIAHFTDLHFTRRPADFPLGDLFSKRGVGWLNLTLGRRHSHFLMVHNIVAAFIEDVLAQELDHIVFTGDLTGVAFKSEFEQAAQALTQLRERSDVLGLPGNHDIYVRSSKRARHFEKYFKSWVRSDREDLAGSSGYPVLRLIDKSAALIAITGARPCAFTDSSGLLGEENLRALEACLKDPEISTRRKVLALHYAPYLADGRADRRGHGLRDAEELLELCRRFGVALMIHGHIHGRYVLSSDIAGLPIANAGSLTDLKHQQAYHIYDIDESAIRLSVRRYDAQQNCFQAWPDAPGSGTLS